MKQFMLPEYVFLDICGYFMTAAIGFILYNRSITLQAVIISIYQ